MKALILILPLFGLTSCETINRVVTPENIGRALVIYDEARGIYSDVRPITPEK